MCGIAGRIGGSNGEHRELVEDMLRVGRHRGPDQMSVIRVPTQQHGTWVLGANRLAIQDPTAAGQQPFSNNRGNICAVTNGEIYNWREIRSDLEQLGHTFHSDCDVEVVPHMYERYGVDMFKRINGMFAMAIIDADAGRAVFARDAAGEKPLFYAETAEGLLFASDIPSLLASACISEELDAQSINEFFTFRAVPQPNTILKQVKRIPSGSYAVASGHGFEGPAFRHFEPTFGTVDNGTETDITSKLEGFVQSAVQIRASNRSTLPLGATLSGGLDSSSIVAWARRENPQAEFNTFSVDVLGNPQELQAIQLVAKHLELKPNVIGCTQNAIRLLPSVIESAGEPIGAGMLVPASQSFNLAHDTGFRVLLSGEGSDELFSGYSGRLHHDDILDTWHDLDHNEQQKYLAQYPKMRSHLERFHKSPPSRNDPLDRYAWWNDDNTYSAEIREKVLLDGSSALDRLRDLDQSSKGGTRNQRMLWLEMKIRLEAFMLSMVDRTSMMHSVESRAPFLDRRIVEAAFEIPPNLKVKDGSEKYILRQVGIKNKLLPDDVINRPKNPFTGPIPTWLQALPVEMERSLLRSDNLEAFRLNADVVRNMYASIQAERSAPPSNSAVTDFLFGTLVLCLWREIVLQGRDAKEFV